MEQTIKDFENVFFIGVAGTGMSALAQYLSGIGKTVSGSDRYFLPGEENETKTKLEVAGIKCYLQNGEGIHESIDLIVVSSAVEDTVPEVLKAKQLNIPIIQRSDLLALIGRSKKTIAVGGTSGKSTTSAMLFTIMEFAGLHPSIISGAGLVSIIKENKIGNAKVGRGEWLIIEADESDSSITKYNPDIGLLLNIDKDHQEIEELVEIFTIFKENTKELFSVNQSNSIAAQLSANLQYDFSTDAGSGAGFIAHQFEQEGLQITFKINGYPFALNSVGKHNMENALAATAVAKQLGISYLTCADALKNYEGIYRRHQLLGVKNGVYVIDDYAHNPAKCAASIAACQPIAKKVIAWFQPHGYGPTRFLKTDFIQEISNILRSEDEIWMSEIFYAGGTATKNISAGELIEGIKLRDKHAYFIENREDLLDALRPHLTDDCVLLLMGARDPGLENFSKELFEKL
jgi:UDP-N-acetylmuramate--alanine ligase